MFKKNLSTMSIILILAVLAACQPAQESPQTPGPSQDVGDQITWIKTFEGEGYGAFLDLILSSSNTIIAVGATNHLHVGPYSGDALLVELSLDGELIRESSWGGEGYEQAWGVEEADDGYYVFGETDSSGAGGRDFFLLKVSRDGKEEWHQTYGRSRREWPYGMQKLANGDLLLYGFSEPESGPGRNQYVLRVSPSGELIWQYLTEGTAEELVLDALETAAGDLVLAVNSGEDAQLVMLDQDGAPVWSQVYPLPGWQYASQIAATDDGGFLLAGFAMASNPRQADTWLARASSSGELLWEKAFGAEEFDDYGTSLIRLKDGSYLIGDISNGFVLTDVDQDGNQIWRRSLVSDRVYGVMALCEVEGGDILAAGLIQISNGRSYDAIILRIPVEGLFRE